MVKQFIVTAMPETMDALFDYVSKEASTGRTLRISVDTSDVQGISQRALAYVWMRKISEKWELSKDLEEVKFTLKLRCYRETGWDFMLTELGDPVSIADLDRGQLFMFMDWLQAFGAMEGLVLVSRGEHKDLKDMGG